MSIDHDMDLAADTGANATVDIPVVGPLSPAEWQSRFAALLQPAIPAGYTFNTSDKPARVLTYKFETAVPADAPADFRGFSYRPFTEAQKIAVRDDFAQWAAVANVRFVEIQSGDADISLGRGDLLAPGAGGLARPNGVGDRRQAWIIMDEERFPDTPRDATNERAFKMTALHEIGHALGLKHPGDYDAGGGTAPGPFLPGAEDNNRYTVMSYANDPDTGARADLLRLYDIAAVQQLWGRNMQFRTGDDVYTGVATPLTSGSTPGWPVTIWDAGGINSLDASNRTAPVRLDLRQGAFSTFDTANDVSIAYGTVIQNARAGSGNDMIIGNLAGNAVDGGAGTDLFVAGVSKSAATFARDGEVIVVDGPAGTDRLTDVEMVQFSDGFVYLAKTGETAAAAYAATTLSLFLEGHEPGANALAVRAQAAQGALDYYANVLKLPGPLGAYESLGRSFSQTTIFAERYGPSVIASDEQFLAKSYQDIFSRAPTEEQAKVILGWIAYFEALYEGVGIPVESAELGARGVVVGHLVGLAVLNPEERNRPEMTLDDQARSYLNEHFWNGPAATSATASDAAFML